LEAVIPKEAQLLAESFSNFVLAIEKFCMGIEC
jgi:hypothetical protein